VDEDGGCGERRYDLNIDFRATSYYQPMMVLSRMHWTVEEIPLKIWIAIQSEEQFNLDKSRPDLPTTLETERLVIRKYEKGDGKELFDLFERNDNRELLEEYVDEAADIKTVKDAETDVEKHVGEWDSRERFVMGFWLKEGGIHIGQIWIEPRSWDVPSFELGYYLDMGYLGQGLATEAAARSVEFIFKELKAHKAIIITQDINERSWRLAERLGFEREGHHRESGIKEGQRYGLYYYGLLRSEYAMKNREE
jgi:RimJ/RimL family protein N-acetyltransferase